MSTIGTLSSSDNGATSMNTINTNFTNINGGKVEGPATNTDNKIPQWNGTNSKILKDGLTAPTGDIVGTTDSQTVSNKTLGTTVLGEVSLQLDAAISADGKWSGITETGTAGTTLVFGNLCYYQTADSRWELADANLSAGYDKKLGMCILAAAGDGSATEMLLIGKINAASSFPTLTIGAPVYMSETAGAITSTQPTTAAAAIRVVGYGNTADELYFNPSKNYIVHA